MCNLINRLIQIIVTDLKGHDAMLIDDRVERGSPAGAAWRTGTARQQRRRRVGEVIEAAAVGRGQRAAVVKEAGVSGRRGGVEVEPCWPALGRSSSSRFGHFGRTFQLTSFLKWSSSVSN